MVALPGLASIPHPEIDTLVAGAAAGDVACFDTLYRRDAERVYNLVLRSCGDVAEAEDVCQEVWTRAHRSLGQLRDAGAFDAWVMRIAARACIDASRRRHAGYDDEAKLAALSDGQDVSEAVEEREHRRLAWQALGALPQRQRLALYLREVESMRYGDIAAAIGATPAAVETLLFRARQGLAQAYGRLADSPGERCQRARHLMAVVLDGEGDAAEQRSLRAHLGDCPGCQRQMVTLNRGRRTYAVLPFAAVAGSFAPSLIPAAGGGLGAAGVLLGLGRIGALLGKATSAVVSAVTAATITAAAVVAAGPLEGLIAGEGPRASATVEVSTASQLSANESLPPSVTPLETPASAPALAAATQALEIAPGLPQVQEAVSQVPSAVPSLAPSANLPLLDSPALPVSLLPPLLPGQPSLPAVPPLPSLPQLPAVSLPQVTTPAVSVPPVALPSLTTPAVTLPPITLPAVQLPAVVSLPPVGVPPVSVPSVTTPPVAGGLGLPLGR